MISRVRGLTHLAITDHDRIDVALEARESAPAGLTVIVGEEVKTADGDLICLFLERAIPPGLSAVETIAAAREQGGAGRHPASVRSDARVAAARCRDGEPRAARRLGRDAQRARRRPRQRGRAGVRARARPARRRGLGRAFDHGDRRRLHGARWRSVHAGRPARRAPERRDRPGPGELLRPASGRRSPRASTGSAGTAASSRPALRAGRSGCRSSGPTGTDGDDRQDHRPVADAGGRSGRVRCDGVDTRARPRRITHHEPDSLDRGARGRDRPRSRRHLARPATAPAADDPVDRRPARHHRASSCTSTANASRRSRSYPPGEPGPRPPRLRRVLPRLPAARLSLGAPPARDRASSSACATRSRSCTSRGSSTASCRPSSATSTAPTCSR